MAGEFDPLSGYADEAALRKQTDFFLKLFEEIEAKGLDVASKLQSSFKLFDNKSTGTKKMADDISSLQLTSANYAKVLEVVAQELDNLTDAQKKGLKAINERFIAEETIRQGAKQSVELMKKEIEQTVKLGAGREALAQTLANNAEAIRQEGLERKRLATVIEAENGSLQKAQGIIDLLINKKKKLNLETEQGRRVNEAFNKAIERENKFILLNADAETKRIKNIGNYAGSAKIIIDAMEAAKKKVADVTKEFGSNSEQVKQATTVYSSLNNIASNTSFLNIAAKVGDTTAELRFFTKQLNVLEDAGLKNSQVYKDMQARLAGLTDQLADTRQEVKALASDSRGFDLFAGSVGFAADTFQTLSGAAVLFGASEKDAAKATALLTAITSVSNGVKGIATQLTTKGTAANLAFSYVQKQVNTVMTQGIMTAKGLNAALNLTGIGIAITLLAGLISKLNIFGDATEEDTKRMEAFTKALKDQRDAINSANEALDDYGKIRDERLKQQAAGDVKIYESDLDTKKTQQDNLVALQLQYLARIQKNNSDAQKLEAKLDKMHWGSIAYNRFTRQKKQLAEELKVLRESYNSVANDVVKNERAIELFKEQQKTKLAEEEMKKQKERDKKSEEARKKAAEEALKDSVDLEKRKAAAISAIAKENINEEIRQQQAIIDNEKTGIEERIAANEKISAAKRALLAIDYSEAIDSEIAIENGKRVIKKKTDEEKLLAETVYQNKSQELQADTVTKGDALRKADVEKIKQGYLDLKNFLNEGADATGANAANIIAIKRNNALAKVEQDYSEGRIKKLKDFEEKKKRITRQSEINEINSAIDVAENKLAIAIAFGENTTAIEKTLTELYLHLQDIEVDKAKETADKKLEAEKKLADKKGELYRAGADLLISIIDGQFDKQKNQIAELIQLSEDQKNADIQRITESTAAEAEKADQIAIINAQAQARKEQLEKRSRELDFQKAQFDRIVAVGEVIANTAKAVTKDLAGNKGLIPFDLAIGALQLAAILARPLPRFKDGLWEDFEGLAITGDGGKREAHIKADGSISITPDRDTVTHIKKGDRIHPDADALFKNLTDAALVDTARASRKSLSVDQYGQLMTKNLEDRLQLTADQIVGAIKNKKELQLNATRDSLTAMWKHGANSISFVEDNTNWNKSN